MQLLRKSLFSVFFLFFFAASCGMWNVVIIYSYIWTHSHWAGVTRISDNLPARKILFKITRICSRSLTLKPLGEEHKNLFTWQTYEHQIIVWELLFITKSNLVSLYLFLYLFYTFFILKFSFSCMSK